MKSIFSPNLSHVLMGSLCGVFCQTESAAALAVVLKTATKITVTVMFGLESRYYYIC
jgi:hypothetical protein